MAQAMPANTQSTFVAKLLAPIAAPVGNRRVLAELRRDAQDAWSIAQYRFWAAKALREHCTYVRRVAEIERRTFRTPEAGAEQRAHLEMIAAVDRMMDIPAPTISALRQKQKLRGFDNGRDRWDAAIAADLSRLQEKA